MRRCRFVLALLSLCAFALAACSVQTRDPASPPQASQEPRGPLAIPTELDLGRCARMERQAAGVTTRQFTQGPDQRTYLLAIPATYTPRRASPLIFDFHGLSSNPFAEAAYSRFNEVGTKRGFFVVTPLGSGMPTRWTLPGFPGVDEVAFVRALLADLGSTFCIDERRVYAAGMSNGAGFSAVLACEMQGRFAAIAPVAGVNLARPCAAGPAVPVIAFHGTDDGVVPYAGGRVLGEFTVPAVEEIVQEWAGYDRCEDGPRDETVGEQVRRRSYRDCRDGSEVRLYTVQGGGHTWPGAVDVQSLGPVTHEIDATELIVDFFANHALQASGQAAS